MEKLKLKKLQMKEQVLLPPNLHDIRDGCVLNLDFEEKAGRYVANDGADDTLFINDGDISQSTSIEVITNVSLDDVSDGTIQEIFSYANNGFKLYVSSVGTVVFKIYNGSVDTSTNIPNAISNGKKFEVSAKLEFDGNTTVMTLNIGGVEATTSFAGSVAVGSGGAYFMSLWGIYNFAKGNIYNATIKNGAGTTTHLFPGFITTDGKWKEIISGNHATLVGATPHDTAIDQSGNGNNGDMIGGVQRVSGWGDLNGVELNRTSKYSDLGNDTSLDLTTKVTFAIIYKPSDILLSWGAIINKGWENYALTISYAKLGFRMNNGTDYHEITFSDDILETNKYTVAIISYDSATEEASILAETAGNKYSETVSMTGAGTITTTTSNLFINGKPDQSYMAGGDLSYFKLSNKVFSDENKRNAILYLKKIAGII